MVRVEGCRSHINTTFLCRTVVLKFWHESESLGGFIKPRLLGSTSRVSRSVNLEGVLRICISNKFLGDAIAADWVPCFENH